MVRESECEENPTIRRVRVWRIIGDRSNAERDCRHFEVSSLLRFSFVSAPLRSPAVDASVTILMLTMSSINSSYLLNGPLQSSGRVSSQSNIKQTLEGLPLLLFTSGLIYPCSHPEHLPKLMLTKSWNVGHSSCFFTSGLLSLYVLI